MSLWATFSHDQVASTWAQMVGRHLEGQLALLVLTTSQCSDPHSSLTLDAVRALIS